ncbi:MAG: hypothetical protein R3F62_30570 [Planctomycetota bacterium]
MAQRFPELLTAGADQQDTGVSDDILFTTEEGKRRKERGLDHPRP